jgi:hypothetical protein
VGVGREMVVRKMVAIALLDARQMDRSEACAGTLLNPQWCQSLTQE